MLHRTIVFSLALMLAAAAVAQTETATPVGPPETRIEVVTDTYPGGVEIADPYRWIEGDNSDPENMGQMTDEVAAWTDAQNAYTRSVLDGLQPQRARLEARLQELMEVPAIGTPTVYGNRYFYRKREGTQPQSVLYLREGLNGEDVVLLDPAEVDPSGLTTIAWHAPNHDGSLMAFGMYTAGDENSTLFVMDVASRTWLADEISGKVGLAGWLADSSGFYYERQADENDAYSSEFRFHKLGTHTRQDTTLFAQRDVAFFYRGKGLSDERLEELRTTWGPFGGPSKDGRWLFVGYWTGTSSMDLWIADLDKWARTGELDLVEMAAGQAGVNGSSHFDGDTLIMETSIGASNGRIVAVDLFNPGMEHWVDLVAEHESLVIDGVSFARGIMGVKYMENAATRIALHRFDGTPMGDLELPGIGTGSLTTSDDRTEAFLYFTSFNMPRSIYRIDLATGERSLWESPDVPVDPSIVEVKQVWYDSKDGTKIPMFIVHKKGLELDGTNPTILYGYGGFNISMTPYFRSTLFPWYENGGVYAIANLRGGGEFGQAWHEAGMLDQKQHVFDDFIGAGEWLIESGYTSPEHLGIAGGSNGGLLTGAVVVQRPDLFAAAVSAVPLLDMLRYQHFLMARYWVPEYGSSEDAKQFEYLRAYSPYQNVKPGTKYPAVLFTAGENDSRVHPMSARKMAALMQASTASDQSEDPILLWVERDAGHGGGKPMHLRIRDVADEQMFFMWQLGMLEQE